VDGAGVAYYEVLEESAATADETDESGAEMTAASAEVPVEIMEALDNASYPLDYTEADSIQLTDGEYREPAAEDSAAEIVTRMTEHVAISELSNGQQIGAVILTTQTGGTGTFYDLVVMNVQDDQLTDPTRAYMGDRIIVNDLSIENDQIVADLVVQGEEDPFCCPTQQVIQTYELDNGQLAQVGSEVIGTVESEPEAAAPITNIVWNWQELITPVEQITVDDPENYTIEFQEDGFVNVVADCNRGSGVYEINSNNISIDITATTLALCEEGSLGELFFTSLGNAAIFFFDDGDLMIDLFADGGTMRFFQ
jgi:heat shock protein HslJ